jgi:hypothetical protein
MRQAVCDGAQIIHDEESHRYHNDLHHILEKHVADDLDADGMGDTFTNWKDSVSYDGTLRIATRNI